MAITISYIGAQRFANVTQDYYNFSAAGSGDTLSFTVTGKLFSIEFFDANGNQILSSGPTIGTVSAGTIPGTNTGTITANSGGVVTNGTMVVAHAGV